jgi:PhnB protein
MSATSDPRQIITPYISVHDAAAALDWYRDAFDAAETVRYVGDDGRLGHAEFVFAGARIMMSDAYPEIGVVAATSHEGSSCSLHIEVTDCDGLHDRSVAHGATSMMAPADQPHGARTATIVDPFGHRWMLSQQQSNPTTAEIDAQFSDFTVIDAG